MHNDVVALHDMRHALSYRLHYATTFVTAPGAWAKKRRRMYLRAPGDADPNTLTVEVSAFRRGMKAALAINSYNLVFNRIIFEKNRPNSNAQRKEKSE